MKRIIEAAFALIMALSDNDAVLAAMTEDERDKMRELWNALAVVVNK